MDQALMQSITALITQIGFPIAVALYYIYKDNKQSGAITAAMAQLAAARVTETQTFDAILTALRGLVSNEARRDEQISKIFSAVSETNVILKVK